MVHNVISSADVSGTTALGAKITSVFQWMSLQFMWLDVLDSGVNEEENMDLFQWSPKMSHLANTSYSTLHRAENNSASQ